MVSLLLTVAALLSLASTSPLIARAANDTSFSASNLTSIEILFPRNETYNIKRDVPVPLVFGIHNLPPTDTLGNYSLHWTLETLPDDTTTIGHQFFGQGFLWPRHHQTPSQQPLILADYIKLDTAIHAYIIDNNWSGRVGLYVFLDYEDPASGNVCRDLLDGSKPPTEAATLSFRVQMPSDEVGFRPQDGAVDIDLLKATGCPAADGGVAVQTVTDRLRAILTSTCLQPVVAATPPPCPFTVDAGMASSISSSVSEMMVATKTKTAKQTEPTSSNRAAAMPIQTGGLAAAGIVGAMMLL